MLGVGGGAAIHQIDRLLDTAQIIGVEFNPVHIKIAEEIFKVSANHIRLEHADAREWVRKHHSQFDVVVDDLFVDSVDDPERPFALDQQWLNDLDRTVGSNGVLIQNHLSQQAAQKAADKVKSRFASCLFFTVPQYENVVLALYRNPVERRHAVKQFEQRLKIQHPGALQKLRYKIRQYY